MTAPKGESASEKFRQFLVPILAAGGGNYALFSVFNDYYKRSPSPGKLTFSDYVQATGCKKDERGTFVPFAAHAILGSTFDGGGNFQYNNNDDNIIRNENGKELNPYTQYTNDNNKRFLKQLAEVSEQSD